MIASLVNVLKSFWNGATRRDPTQSSLSNTKVATNVAKDSVLMNDLASNDDQGAPDLLSSSKFEP